jgi:hypothetical protein
LIEKGYRNEIIFPQNFIPVPGIKYNNLQVKLTLTGSFKFNGKTYDVSRAYHPDFDYQGNPISTTANIVDEINFQIENKDKHVKMENGFSKLSKIRNQLPSK